MRRAEKHAAGRTKTRGTTSAPATNTGIYEKLNKQEAGTTSAPAKKRPPETQVPAPSLESELLPLSLLLLWLPSEPLLSVSELEVPSDVTPACVSSSSSPA